MPATPTPYLQRPEAKPRSSKPGNRGITLAQYKAALEKHAAALPFVALELGVSPQAVHERVKNNPELQTFIVDLEARIVAAARSVIVHAIVQKKSERWSAWWLERKGGFTTKQELTGPNGGPIPVTTKVHCIVEYVTSPGSDDEEDVI